MLQKHWFAEYEKEDYGQSLAKWCWSWLLFSLPVLGPSTVRDTAASFANVLGGDALVQCDCKK